MAELLALGTTALLNFEVHTDFATRDTQWAKWFKCFKHAMVGFDIKDEKESSVTVLFYVGPDLQDEFDTLTETGEDKDYKKAMLTMRQSCLER